jgi:dipeptidyl aminopeptidase/acylaminoacyl peptidase
MGVLCRGSAVLIIQYRPGRESLNFKWVLRDLPRSVSVLGAATLALILCLEASLVRAQESAASEKRAITVADGIEMSRLADPQYFLSGSGSAAAVAHFSPNGKHFVVLTRKGKLARNTNEFTLLLFHTSEIFHSAVPHLLVAMESSSNRDAIRDVKWLADSETIAFIGENPDEVPQVYTFNIATRVLHAVTHQSTAIAAYDIRADGKEILFVAEPPVAPDWGPGKGGGEGVIVSNQSLLELIGGICIRPPWIQGQIFVQESGQDPIELRVPMGNLLAADSTVLSLAPDGRYALVGVWVNDVPATWTLYRSKRLHQLANAKRTKSQPSYLKRYLLFDSTTRELIPLMNSPMLTFTPFVWTPDSKSIALQKVFLPLNPEKGRSEGVQIEARRRTEYDVQIELLRRDIKIIRAEGRFNSPDSTTRLEVRLEEDVNTPPQLTVMNRLTHEREVLLSLNPQFASLRFGQVKQIEWRATDGHWVQGGLYLPPDFRSTHRYPLVIQTHGFSANRFSIDGRGEWSSGFSARPLAARGMVVLQVGSAKTKDDSKYSNTLLEGPREMAAYEGAIRHLDQLGLIDVNRVGIVGFSRTVYSVAYSLTHSRYHFAAASLVDGIDGGYFQYIAFGAGDDVFLNGGQPFGKGFKLWAQRSPGFNLDRIRLPLRLVALGPAAVLEAWEWFTVLSQLSRPVDFLFLRDASHLVAKPSERMQVQESMGDWFSFWLTGQEDLSPAKAEQYRRWSKLKRP